MFFIPRGLPGGFLGVTWGFGGVYPSDPPQKPHQALNVPSLSIKRTPKE